MASVEKRISDLEAAIGGEDKCPRCSHTLVIEISGDATSVTRRGSPWLEGVEAQAFAAQEQPGNRCPLCGRLRRAFGIGWNRRDTGQH